MTLVVDASVAMKWLVETDGSVAARDLIGADILVAPELIAAEVANALWRYVANGQMAAIAGEMALGALTRTLDQLYPTEPLAASAYGLACRLGHTAYDCFYLVLAERVSATLITADRRLVAKVAGTAWQDRVRLL